MMLSNISSVFDSFSLSFLILMFVGSEELHFQDGCLKVVVAVQGVPWVN